MKSSIKQWHKSLLFASVVLALSVQASPVNADGNWQWLGSTNYVLNEYQSDQNGWLTKLGFATEALADPEVTYHYQLAVYHDFTFDGTNGSFSAAPLWSHEGNVAAGISVEVTVDDEVVVRPADPYYVVLGLTTSSGAQGTYRYGLPNDAEDWGTGGSYNSDLYEFGNAGTSYAWTDMTGGRWGIAQTISQDDPNPPTKNIAVTAEHVEGDWSVVDTYNAAVDDDLLTVTVAADNDGPHDMEITVTGGMDPITVEGTITNSTSDDWDGLCIQLGYGLGGDFVLAADGLSFAGLGSNQFVSLDGIDAGDGTPFSFGINMGDRNIFTARIFAVPEPSSLLLLALSGLALLTLGRPKR